VGPDNKITVTKHAQYSILIAATVSTTRWNTNRRSSFTNPHSVSAIIKSAIESRIKSNGDFGETPGKLLTLKYNLLLPQRGKEPTVARNFLPGKLCETPFGRFDGLE